MSRVVPHAQSQPQPDGTVLTPRPMHNVVFDMSGCGDAFFHDSRDSEPFTSKLHKIAIAQSLGPRSHGNPSLARPPVSLQKNTALPPTARPTTLLETKAGTKLRPPESFHRRASANSWPLAVESRLSNRRFRRVNIMHHGEVD